MGLTKQYLRFVPGPVFNIIGSAKCNISLIPHQKGNLVACGACEDVYIWNVRKSEKVMRFLGDTHEATAIAISHNGKQAAVGYSDGAVKIFEVETGDCNMTLKGHSASVTCLVFQDDDMRLSSGSKDTEIVMWDLVAECGLYRFRGHKGPITSLKFLPERQVLVSASKDMAVKLWDLVTQHCFHTIVGHRSEVWDMVVLGDNRVITGSGDNELRVWEVKFADTEAVEVSLAGSIIRSSTNRVQSMSVDPSGTLLLCHDNSANLELFHVFNEEESLKRAKKRVKKERKRMMEKSKEEAGTEVTVCLQDQIRRLKSIKTKGKLKSVDVVTNNRGGFQIAVLLSGNCLCVYRLTVGEEAEECYKVYHPGHRTDPRTLAFDSDSAHVVSASGDSLKVWNCDTRSCIRTIECEYAVSCLFVPGDRHVIVGTKSGRLQVFEVTSGILLEVVDAHEGAVWSLCMMPDQKGLVSGSADKTVKFWNFELISDEDFSTTAQRLSITHVRSLQLTEDVLAVRFSPDHRLIAVSLLDSSLKVFFVDSLKFFLSLYGHKLPALCFDICYDSSLLASGGSDRNVKIWGLDFGDCHRSLFAHDDSVTALQFIPKTHMFFSAGRDGKIKQWDADNFQMIVILRGHHEAVWAMCVSRNGQTVASAGHDKSIRLWMKTQEPLVLEDEREQERELEQDVTLATQPTSVVPGERSDDVGLPGKKSADTERAAEDLMEAVDTYKSYLKLLEDVKPPAPPPQPLPLMIAYNTTTPHMFLAKSLRRIKSSEIEECLLVVPFGVAYDLMSGIADLLERNLEVELCCRVVFFLVKVHHPQMVSSGSMFLLLERLRGLIKLSVRSIKDRIGFNMAGLRLIQDDLMAREQAQVFAEATERFKDRKRKKKRKEMAAKRAVLSII